MQVQTGGDPGLAALIAAILSGGVGYVGYKKDTRTAQEVAAEGLSSECKTSMASVATSEAKAKKAEEKTVLDAKKISELQAELDSLKARCSALEASSSALSAASVAFKNASPEALRAAIPLVLRKIAASHPWIKADGSNTPLLRKALEYPATYTGRLTRMSLTDFYQKRVLKAADDDYRAATKGGRRKYRRRARRGGDMLAELQAVENEPTVAPVRRDLIEPGSAASYAKELFSFPTAEEFAQLYGQAINEASALIPTAREKENARIREAQKSVEEGNRIAANAKENKIARNASEELARKISSVTTDAEKVIETVNNDYVRYSVDNPTLVSTKDAFTDLIKEAKLITSVPESDSTNFAEHKKVSLYDATPLVELPANAAPGSYTFDTSENWVASWESKKAHAQEVLDKLNSSIIEYPKAIEAAKAAKLAPPPAPEVFSYETNPMAIKDELEKQQQIRSELDAKAKAARTEQEAALETSLASPKPKTRRKEKFGGKARKRTLKKRRGGK